MNPENEGVGGASSTSPHARRLDMHASMQDAIPFVENKYLAGR
jgi:hypothetical protein